GAVVVGAGTAVFRLSVLAVKDERNVLLQRYMEWNCHQSVAERQEDVPNCLKPDPGQLPVEAAVAVSHDIGETRLDEGLVVLPPDVGIEVRGPGHRQRMHPVMMLQLPGNRRAVFSAAAGDENVVTPVLPPVLIAEADEFFLPLGPIDGGLLL